MNRLTVVVAALFCVLLQMSGQSLTEAERQEYVYSQMKACKCYLDQKQWKDGYLLAKKLLQDNLNEKERQDIGALYVMNGYLYACEFIKRDERGRADYGRGREILSEILPYANGQLRDYVLPKIPLSYFFEGGKCVISQSYDEALTLYGKALDGFRELGRVSEEISVLKEMASVKSSLCEFDDSKELFSRALVLARQESKVNRQMDILMELWSLGNTLGDMALIHAASVSMDSLVEVSGDVRVRFSYYRHKGDEARDKGQCRLAEKWYVKGKELAEEKGQNQYAANKGLAYMKLKDLYVTMGEYDEAVTYGLKELAEYQSQMHPEEYGYYLPYISLADIYRDKGDRENCFACIDSLFLGLDRIAEPRELCHLYMTRARCHYGFNEYDAAIADYRLADKVLATKYPQSEENRIRLLALIGGLEHQRGNYKESKRLYQLYAEYAGQLYGEKSMEYVNALIILANAEGFSGHNDIGCQNYMRATLMLRTLMKERIPYMSAEERESFWGPVSSLFTKMTPYALAIRKDRCSFTRSCYDALVMSKSFLLESERSLADAIKQEGTKEDVRDYMQLALMRSRIREWERDEEKYHDSILSVSRKADMLAVSLAERCRGLSDIACYMDIDYDRIKQALGPNDVLLDFTDYISESAGRKYAAYVINKVDEYPQLKYLFAERQMDSLGITRPDMYYDNDYAPDVLKLLWEPLKEHIAEGATVYYVPSQLLFQVSLESLPLADGSLLGSHYNFVRLSSARELVRGNSPCLSATPMSAVLYGGLQYDLQESAMAGEARKYVLSDLLVMRGDVVRGDSVFRELPGSRLEVMQIDSILRTNGWNVSLRMGAEGTEESFLSMHGRSPQVLQIATHGFYYTPDCAEAVDYLKGYSDAMSLSGIVLSGGNAAWLGRELPEDVLGGILSANNIARLDLSSTEMVILSACQSGQGRATPEGLYGLQRAFKKAGAGTIVMALWNVSDKVATEFMTTFYEKLTSRQCKWNKRQAFEKTKSIIREKYPDPFHWAAFVMLD